MAYYQSLTYPKKGAPPTQPPLDPPMLLGVNVQCDMSNKNVDIKLSAHQDRTETPNTGRMTPSGTNSPSAKVSTQL